MKKTKMKELKNYAGLEYVTVSVPVKESKYGEVVDVPPLFSRPRRPR